MRFKKEERRMNGRGRFARRMAAALTMAGIAAMMPAGAAQAGPVEQPTVHLRGTAYTFNTSDPIVGATVRIAELPALVGATDANGAYDLPVPDGTKITPYIEAEGHYPIYLQTWVTAGRNIERANFQTPNTPTYQALAGLLGVQVGPNGKLVNCAIVSTFSTQAVRDLSMEEFWEFGAHGVAGATATTSPQLPGAIYFNESVIPDPSRTDSSEDGGVLWTEVPTGTYRVTGHHPTTRFAEFNATCEPGRVVNANPPQGLYELREGETVDTEVAAEVTSAKVKRRGKKRIVKVSTAAAEYVSVAAAVTRGAKELAATEPGDGVGAYASGRRTLKLKLPRKPKRGKVRLVTTFADAYGNELAEHQKLRLPKRKKRK
jgi:hypothetical protein